MNILDKLQMQTKLGGVLLFREGLFLKAYNESCYILTQLLSQDLKLKCYSVKCLKHSWVVESAFQRSKLASRLPNAVITDFGSRLSGDFDLSGYDDWYARRCRAANEVKRTVKAEVRPLQTVSPSAAASLQNTVDVTSVLLPLTTQQLLYLQTWQKALYPPEVDLGFIESLKKQLMLLR